MLRKNRCRSRRGESLVETVSSVFIVSIGVCGLAASSVVSVRSEKLSSDVDRAAGTAGAAVEDMRSAVMRGDWSRLQTQYDQKQMLVDGASNTTTDKMVVTVSERAADLKDSTAMWQSGADAPNFVFVKIGAANAGQGGAAGAQMQTYIANRTALGINDDDTASEVGTGGSGGGTDGGGTIPVVSGLAAQFEPAISNFTASGTATRSTSYNVKNGGAAGVRVTSATLTLPPGNAVKKFSIGKTVAFNNTKGTSPTVTMSWTGTKGPLLSPGDVAAKITHVGNAISASTPGTMTFTFSDGSSYTWSVGP